MINLVCSLSGWSSHACIAHSVVSVNSSLQPALTPDTHTCPHKCSHRVQLAKATLAREQAMRAKHEEELQLLAEGAAAMEAERQMKADKAEAAKQLWQATMRGNDERIVAKKQAELLQRQKDEELMQESIR